MFRILKILIGLVLVGYGAYSGNNWFYFGIIPLMMAICDKCPLGGCKDGACEINYEDKIEENSCCSSKKKEQKIKTMNFSSVAPSKIKTQCCNNDNVIVIKILGTGCANCITLYNTVNTAIKELNGDFEVIKVEDIQEIMHYDVINTPGLIINEVVKSSGKVLTKQEVQELINGSTKDLGNEIKTKCCGD